MVSNCQFVSPNLPITVKNKNAQSISHPLAAVPSVS